jgi:hypothetical protein
MKIAPPTLQGLPAPALVAADVNGRNVGDGVPVAVIERLPGRPTRSVDILKETAATDCPPITIPHAGLGSTVVATIKRLRAASAVRFSPTRPWGGSAPADLPDPSIELLVG